MRKLALSTVSLVLVLCVLELVVRGLGLGVHDFLFEKGKYAEFQIINREADYFYYPPNSTASFWGSDWKFNSLGLRDIEPARTKAPGAFRVVFLGDSVTAGERVAQGLIFPYRVRDLFAASSSAEVIAAGVSGWNTLEEERFLGANIERLDPDLVVLLYVMNDNEPVNNIRRVIENEGTLKDRILDAMVLRSRLFEWMAFLWRKRLGPDLHKLSLMGEWKNQVKAAGPPFAATDPGWIASRASLLGIRDLLRARGTKLVIFFYNLGAFDVERTALERLREFGRESGVRVFDTLPFFAGHKWQSVVNSPFVDPHPNADGHELLAAGIARTLVDEGFIPVRGRDDTKPSQ